MQRYMLTTVDNPHNPYTHFEEWLEFDMSNGYNSLQFLARVVKSSNDLSDEQQQWLIQQGIEEIVHYNVSGMHTKVAAPSNDEGEVAE